MAFYRFFFQTALLAVIYSGLSCGTFLNENIGVEKEPLITTSNLVEIKEQQPTDAYGFSRFALVKESKVKKNESIYTILSEAGVSPQVIYQLAEEAKGVFNTHSLREGQHYLLYNDPAGENVSRMIIHLNALDYVVFDWGDHVSVSRGQKKITKSIEQTFGVITSSLYQSLSDNQVNPLLGNKLSEIFGWQIDFFALQKGDAYKIIYEQHYVDGEPFGVGDILAATFTHKGKLFDAFYYAGTERAGYFDRNGQGLQKTLLKAPFKYSQRISSGFSHNRFHPVLGKRMPHYGIDYAAPLNTPVIAVGDGEVIEARYRGANGNIVKIKHNSVYTTAYLHLNGFAKGIKPGAKVKQGQVIGYVGRTGRVTGVHLDYRIYVNGTPVNPLNVELPPSKALTGSELERFQLYIERYQFLLDQMGDDHLFAFN